VAQHGLKLVSANHYLIEGIIDHQLLGVHYVRQVPNYTVYNLTFLAIGGAGFIVIGWLMMRAGRSPSGD
jgi:uncharacterized membrane protein